MTDEMPTGTVTIMFTDIEASTLLWDTYPEEMGGGLRRHDELVRASIERAGGCLFGFMVADVPWIDKSLRSARSIAGSLPRHGPGGECLR